MKARNLFAAMVVGAGLMGSGAWAQHEDHHQDQAAPAADQAGGGKMGGMMGGMMSGNMMMGQNETGKLVEQLMQNLAAMEAEKDPAALKTKLAEHSALLKELQAKVQRQGHMMEMMQHMMGGMMAGDEHKK
jgi:hypothetical protein